MGLKRRPFGLTADVDLYFPGSPAEATREALHTAFERREGFALVDGPSGVGKTFTALAWLDRLAPEVPRVWLPHTLSNRPADLLQAILFDLGQPYEGLSEQELRLAVTTRLLDALRTGRPLVIVIDEAQHLSAAALEELRLLGNVDSRYGKGLFAVLVAQPGFRDVFARPELDSFAQRLTTRVEMTPLDELESRAYLTHHIRRAGGVAEASLTEEAVDLLVEHGAGLPRRLSLLAGQAFDLALAGEADTVDAEVVIEVLERLGVEAATKPEAATLPTRPRGDAEDRGKGAVEPAVKKATRRRSA